MDEELIYFERQTNYTFYLPLTCRNTDVHYRWMYTRLSVGRRREGNRVFVLVLSGPGDEAFFVRTCVRGRRRRG